MTKIEIVAATRGSVDQFWLGTPLGLSVPRLLADQRLTCHPLCANALGLSDAYNGRIRDTDAGVLVFVHDDVWIEDYFLADRVLAGLERYQVIGVAGSRTRVPGQPSWMHAAYAEGELRLGDRTAWSGAVAHGSSPVGLLSSVSYYGPTPAECELLDGVFLVARVQSLREAAVQFDPQFAFHFYDQDFCRTARQRGLKLGTWPIALTHSSVGAFGTPDWQQGYQLYLKKWGD